MDLKIIPFALYAYVLAKILQNGANLYIQKTGPLFETSYEKFGIL